MTDAKVHSVLTVNGEAARRARATTRNACSTCCAIRSTSPVPNAAATTASAARARCCSTDAARASCLTLAADVGERPVTTIEGIAGDADFSPIQRTLIETGAIQCGFCTPGFVMALTDLFARDPHPDRATIRMALSGNLCRCSGYVKIVEAAERLAGAVDG